MMPPMVDYQSGMFILASGSAGNAAFLRFAGFGLLVDFGLEPRLLGHRLAKYGFSWNDVDAAILTHLHADHWKEKSIQQFWSMKIPLYVASAMVSSILKLSEAGRNLQKEKLLKTFPTDGSFSLLPDLMVHSLTVPHDANPTLAFMFHRLASLFHSEYRIVHATDLGIVPKPLEQWLSQANLVSIEFNHDVEMQEASSRPDFLIRRVLSAEGHLSNEQAAQAILNHCSQEQLDALIQLHLSQECNDPGLARQTILNAWGAHFASRLVTAKQSEASVWIHF